MSDWATRLEARRKGRRILAVLAAVGAVILLLCMGFTPMLLRGVLPRTDNRALSNQLGCSSIDLASVPTVKNLSKEQVANAAAIIAVGRQLKVPPRGWVIAIATALQESTLHNRANPKVPVSLTLPHQGVGSDHDSLGLFQQRPSWGAPAQVLDPRYASAKFYAKLVQLKGWERMRVTDAAQQVQRSAFPGAYQKWENLAALLVAKLSGEALRTSGGAPQCALPGQISAAGWTAPAKAEVGSGFRTRDRPGHDGVDLIAARNAPIWAAAGGIVVEVVCNSSSGTCDRDGSPDVRGCGWYVDIAQGGGVRTRYCHMAQRPSVVVGQRVNAGDLLGYVGSSGNSSGPHLHFEVHLKGNAIDPIPFMATHGAPLGQSS
jgi:hypothetical protein